MLDLWRIGSDRVPAAIHALLVFAQERSSLARGQVGDTRHKGRGEDLRWLRGRERLSVEQCETLSEPYIERGSLAVEARGGLLGLLTSLFLLAGRRSVE
ncbi:hypothetical protein IQ61_01935 [Streptomyces scabiei]|nr:hypothetical protein IQ61_01935 [Streptomyces scabiei]